MILVGEGHADLTERVPDLLRLGLTILRTPTLSTLSTALKAQGIPLIGIEIMKESQTVQELAEKWRETPNAPIALMPGNEGSGLNEPQKKVCDGFVIIPQYGIGTASLNVMVAFTTVAHALTYHQLPPPSTKEKGPGNRGSKWHGNKQWGRWTLGNGKGKEEKVNTEAIGGLMGHMHPDGMVKAIEAKATPSTPGTAGTTIWFLFESSFLLLLYDFILKN